MLMFGDRAASSTTEIDDYVEVELRFFPTVGGETPIELRLTPTRKDFPPVRAKLDLPRLAALEERPRAYGEELGAQLFDNTPLGGQFTELWTALKMKGADCRIRLRLDDPALETIYWERICYRENGAWSPLAAAADRPFSRFVPSDWQAATPLTERPVPFLLVYASPGGLSAVKLAAIPPAERDAIRAALTEREAAGQVACSELGSGGAQAPTLAALRKALTRSPAIVHFLCHGLKGDEGSALVLEGEDGAPRVTTPEELLDAIKGAATRPRLIVLSACESAAATGAAAFVSLGPALAAAGVDAVLAMSAAVSMDTARAFCSHFYERLFAHGVIDRAVNEARASVRDALDWGVPVLFSRMRDCQLLEFAASRVDAAYLSVSDRTVRAALLARGQGEREQVAGDVLAATTALVEELERSHKLLTGVCADFRRTGDDPATFKQQFEGFRNNFKEYFDNQAWNSERTRCHEVEGRAQPAMALFEKVLPPADFQQLKTDLRQLSDADGTIIEHLAKFLSAMDKEVDEIAKLLRTNIPAAIERKLKFEDEISPTFRRSKELLQEIATRSHRVRAA